MTAFQTLDPDRPDPAAELVAQRETPWQQVEIYHHPIYGHQLWIDGDLQISECDRAYNTAMNAPLLTLEACRHVAILGGGDGGVMNELLQVSDLMERPLEQVTLVDIDGEVIDLCQRHLPRLCGEAFEDQRAEVIVGDAFAWIDAARDLDAVIYDLTMEPVTDDMDRLEFMADILDRVHRSLRPGGVFSMQACGELQSDREQWLAACHEQIGRRFAPLTEQTVMVPSYGEAWTFLAARKAA